MAFNSWRDSIPAIGATVVLRLAGVLLLILIPLLAWTLSRSDPSAPASAPASSPRSETLLQSHAHPAIPRDPSWAVLFDPHPMGGLPRDPSTGRADPAPGPVAGPAPPATKPERLDPRRLRRIMDMGVVTYGSAAGEQQKTKGAKLLQVSALLGFAPARRLVLHNYPRAPTVREVVSASDAVRYAIGLLADDPAAKGELVALGRFLAGGEGRRFATGVTEALRADPRYRGANELEALLAALAQIPRACGEIAAVLGNQSNGLACGPTLLRELLQFVQASEPADAADDERRRAFALADEVGGLP
jgi:hypothetical protein